MYVFSSNTFTCRDATGARFFFFFSFFPYASVVKLYNGERTFFSFKSFFSFSLLFSHFCLKSVIGETQKSGVHSFTRRASRSLVRITVHYFPK